MRSLREAGCGSEACTGIGNNRDRWPGRLPGRRRHQLMETKPVAHILAQLQQNPVDFLRRLQIRGAGDPVADGFHRADEVLMHDAGMVKAVGILPELYPIDPQDTPEKFRGAFCKVANGMDSIACQPGFCRPAHIEEFPGSQRPDLFTEILSPDLRDRIGLFHIRTQLCKHFAERDADADSEPQFLLCGLPDFSGNIFGVSVYAGAGHIQPALIHAKWLHQIGVSVVDLMNQLGIFEVLIVLGRDDDQSGTELPRLPADHAGLDTGLLRQLGLCQHDAMPVFRGTADSNRFSRRDGSSIISTDA